MKKTQILTLAATLALGCGSIFAASAQIDKAAPVVEADQAFEIQINDAELQKAYEAGEVNIVFETEDTASMDVDQAFDIQIDDAELQKAYEAGEVNIVFETAENAQ